ncbi:MAG TPA: hypothetical protein VKB93_16365 [Thermoanaerobaculia bacterium]|nr:hypothetical protein [Thermoanaerobaculia bacterium]
MRRAAAIAFLLLLTCKKAGDPIAATIDAVAKAAEDRDAGAVAEKLAANYADDNGGRREAEEALRRYFFAYESVDLTIRDLKTYQTGPTAQARFLVAFSGTPKEVGGLDQLLPSSATYRFDVWMIEEGGTWKITNAQWRPEG